MTSRHPFSRRSFLAFAAAAPLAAAPGKKIPIGLELYSVRKELSEDLMGTVRAVGEMGYDGVEFYGPYFEWTPDYAKQVRALLDGLGIKCCSTHNSAPAFEPGNIAHAIELNKILGSEFVVLASAGRVEGIDGWKKVAEKVTSAAAKMRPVGLSAGYHNHAAEFRPVEGQLPIEVIAANTPHDVVLQLDVGTCLEAGKDPVAWINKNPGRLREIHCKDWSSDPNKGYQVLFGEGDAPWKKIFEAAEKTGGVEYFLIEQEGSPTPPLEAVKICLESMKKMRA